MQFERAITEFRELLAQLTHEVQMSVSSGHTNIAHISEAVFLRLLNALYGWHLKDMNAKNKNYPAIDLADEDAGVAVQVTATASLDKVKDTISAFLRHELHLQYSRLIIFVITGRQNSYQQQSIDSMMGSRMTFDVRQDIMDCQTLAVKASKARPRHVHIALSHLTTYLRGVTSGLTTEDFNPPSSPQEELLANLIPIRIPDTLYIADLMLGQDQRGVVDRSSVRRWFSSPGAPLPSDYEVRRKQLLTFRDLSQHSPFERAIDPGTVTPLYPQEYYEHDQDQERTFKSLLRLVLQHYLYQRRVRWSHEDHVFFFCPREPGQMERTEKWFGHRSATRKVFQRRMLSTDPTKVLSTKHLAFSVNFLLLSKAWYLVVTPNWFFSYGDDFARSRFADEQLSRLKRIEKERSVTNVFRFIASWLSNNSRTRDLFSHEHHDFPSIEFGRPICIAGGRSLDDDSWAPVTLEDVDDFLPLFESVQDVP